MLVPESKDEKERAHLARMTAWLESKSEEERKKYCPHGNSAVLAKLTMPIGCKYCNEEKEKYNGK